METESLLYPKMVRTDMFAHGVVSWTVENVNIR